MDGEASEASIFSRSVAVLGMNLDLSVPESCMADLARYNKSSQRCQPGAATMDNVVEGLGLTKRSLKAITTTKKKDGDGDNSTKIGSVDLEEPLSPSARLLHEPHFNLYIIAIIGCKTKINPTVVKDGLVHTLLKHPRFCSLQVEVGEKGGKMKWVPTEVNLENHVIVPKIYPEMDLQSPDKSVEDYISDLSKTEIDMSKPLWELHLLNIKTADAEAVGIFKIHHSLGDGTSLVSLLLACTRQTADPNALPTIPVTKTTSVRSSGNNTGISWIFMAIWGFLLLAWNTLVDIFMFFATTMFIKDTETPLKGAPGVEFAPKRFVHRSVSLDDIKLVKNAMNTTINDVVLGVTTAGLSRYLNRRYGEDTENDVGATENRNNLPKNIRLRSTLLVNIRPSSGIQALSDMMEEKAEAKWGNWIGYVLFPFTIALRDDPLDYVRQAKLVIDRKKNSYEALYTFVIAEIVLKLFGIKASAALTHRILTHTTMSFSNVVGPLEEIGFYGHQMSYIAPSVFGHPHAFTINYQSYVNKMTIVLAVDKKAVPDPHKLCDDLEESLKLIKDAVVAKYKDGK
ncbi:O-acyltransferase WSD1-like [Papaver somniferum]|uniref:O-acyltransferase WSD1-like n=1 Tax=Papaver somniferum TaxID=3469 RepID=UPI000E705667|nr:O-acyltransferase WSD1-like [Papaver somniferum]